MSNKRFRYFIFKYVLSLLGDNAFSTFMRGVNALRFKAPLWSNTFLRKGSFNDKINAFKLSSDFNRLQPFADKLLFRNLVAQKIGEQYLVPLYAQFENIQDFAINDSWFPCVVKLNRGSGMNLFINEFHNVHLEEIKRELSFWASVDPFYYSRERHYSNTNPVILIEKSLGEGIDDFKMFCFEGKAMLVQVDHGRFKHHTRSFFFTDWSPSSILFNYQPIPFDVPQPGNLNEMIRIAEILAADFSFLRVDFYMVDGRLYVGEMTFFPEGGQGVFHNPEDDIFLGKMIVSDQLIVSKSSA